MNVASPRPTAYANEVGNASRSETEHGSRIMRDGGMDLDLAG